MLSYKLNEFDNGLKLITAPLGNTKAVTILLLFKVGSRYEEKNLNGISHFLEHMFFKGTKKRPTTLDIARDLDNVGAGYNAYTGEEYTGYFVRATSEHFDLGLDVLTDILFNAKLDEAEIAKEKGVIVEEINMINDSPRQKVELVAKELVYSNHPLGRKITGEKATVTGFSRADFVNYKNRFYQPANLVMAVAGGGKEQDWIEKIAAKFKNLPKQPSPAFQPIREKQNKPQVKLHYQKTDQAHFILGYRSLKRTDPRRPIMKVLTNLMGQMMSSRLFIEVREKRGLCYYIGTDMADFTDAGFWAVFAGVDIGRAEEAIKIILSEIGKLKKREISKEELTRARENLKGHLYLGLEESMAVAELLAEQQLFWGEIKDPDEIVKEYEQVTARQIKDLAGELFTPSNLNLAMVGPFKNESKFEKLLK